MSGALLSADAASALPRYISLSEAIGRAEAMPPFRVPGLVHSALTGISGEPFVGKSSLIAHLVVSGLSGAPFLGVDWTVRPDRFLVLCTDPGGVNEYGKRFQDAGLSGDREDRLHLLESVGVTNEWWERLRTNPSLPLSSQSVVIVDNLTGAVDDLNDGQGTGAFFAQINEELCRFGIGVVLTLHRSDKRGASGYKPTVPMGHTGISGAVRHRLDLTRSNGSVRLTTRGNQASDRLDITFRQGEHAADMVISSSESRASRPKETLDKNRAKVDFLLANPSAVTKKDKAALLATQFGGRASGYEKALQPSRPLGQLLAAGGGTT